MKFNIKTDFFQYNTINKDNKEDFQKHKTKSFTSLDETHFIKTTEQK